MCGRLAIPRGHCWCLVSCGAYHIRRLFLPLLEDAPSAAFNGDSAATRAQPQPPTPNYILFGNNSAVLSGSGPPGTRRPGVMCGLHAALSSTPFSSHSPLFPSQSGWMEAIYRLLNACVHIVSYRSGRIAPKMRLKHNCAPFSVYFVSSASRILPSRWNRSQAILWVTLC